MYQCLDALYGLLVRYINYQLDSPGPEGELLISATRQPSVSPTHCLCYSPFLSPLLKEEMGMALWNDRALEWCDFNIRTGVQSTK